MLTQNQLENVEKAIHNLRQADLMEPHALYNAPVEELEELLRPAGYFRVKARRLRSLLEFNHQSLRRLANSHVSDRFASTSQ